MGIFLHYEEAKTEIKYFKAIGFIEILR